MEAELVALSLCVREVLAMRRILSSIGVNMERPTTIYMDNQAAMMVGTCGQRSNKSKHIELQYFLAQKAIQDGEIVLEYIASKNNVVDMLTKELSKDKMEHCMGLAGMLPYNGKL